MMSKSLPEECEDIFLLHSAGAHSKETGSVPRCSFTIFFFSINLTSLILRIPEGTIQNMKYQTKDFKKVDDKLEYFRSCYDTDNRNLTFAYV